MHPTKTGGEPRKGKQFLLHMWHLSCYLCYKPGDKSLMRKLPIQTEIIPEQSLFPKNIQLLIFIKQQKFCWCITCTLYLGLSSVDTGFQPGFPFTNVVISTVFSDLRRGVVLLILVGLLTTSLNFLFII